ncbi:MAG: L-seryl-tRNA(Sec) selenium transferase [Calditrichaeota bacterium]|nr:MAG: L-seryl-tRNA(Sec) selenium transferase [Calditrichota bacterium]
MKSATDLQERYRAIPSVQELLQAPEFHAYSIAPQYLKQIIQEEIHRLRQSLPRRSTLTPERIPHVLMEAIRSRLEGIVHPRLIRVINATGIILHTNMGRAPLAEAARKAIGEAAEHYCNLEIDLGTGRRGDRMAHVEELLCLLTGAEAALVVNNCAAAVFLVLNSLCKKKEVPVSRGELVEIGGSFRMPEVMKASGAKMVEVGTTNKTHLQDYEEVISARTGALLKVHTSNYRILGFTAGVAAPELVTLAHRHDLPVIYDMGSGVIQDLQQWGYSHEPLAREMVEAGVDVITFSGDKILGGPQAGIILGKRRYVQKIRRNHLTRALRCDKLILAALEATLRLYLEPEKLPQRLPIAGLLTVSRETLHRRGERLCSEVTSAHLHLEVVEAFAQMGSGALPLEKIPSVAVKVTSSRFSPLKLAEKLRRHHPPIVGYVQEDAFFLNLRTVREDELETLTKALNSL